MNISLLIITLFCCMFLHGVDDVNGDSFAIVMDKRLRPHPCLDQERSALLGFLQGVSIYKESEGDYHKTDSWKAGEDCCASWDGVECDRLSGHVIGLYLNGLHFNRYYDGNYDTSRSCINGSISGNNTIFQLSHLQKLNLSHNALHGQIPYSIFHLSNLNSLDLSYNDLRLYRPNLKDLVHNLTKLESLHLDGADMAGSTLHDSLSNNSCLKSIHLSNCGLSGEFPSSTGIFYLSKLRILDVSYNIHLNGHLPDFDGSSSLEELRIADTSISGKLPSSIGELSFLKVLDIGGCNFSARLPSLGRLANLTYLDLSGNDFRGQTVSAWLANLTQLVTIDLSRSQLTGQVLSSLSSLTRLESLSLHHNHFTGSIPYFLANLTNLQHIDLSSNQFQGSIPDSFSNLSKLRSLDLSSNNLNGMVELDMFHKLGDLSFMVLSHNNLSLLVNEYTSSLVPDKYELLELGSCNLDKFPNFLLNQSQLQVLDLSNNRIRGMVPSGIWNHSLTLFSLNISHNFLTTIEDHPIMLPGSSLSSLDISFNMLQGSLPVPPLSTNTYLASGNSFSGYLSPLFCSLSSLFLLDVSNNNISGTIPQCPDTFGQSMSLLNLQNNKLEGTIPQSWAHGSNLVVIVVSQNHLEGKIPRSLGNCKWLEFIDFGNNCIADTFPYWLGDLPELKVLMLQSNRFHGEIQNLEGKALFSRLRIIDISFNGFSGKLPPMFFKSWEFIKSLDADKTAKYMEIRFQDYTGVGLYKYTMKITNKGMEMFYPKIMNTFRAIDFSYNQFQGEIPTSIAKLHGLHLLNLGHNNFTGTIPSWLGNLRQLESLDLSHNKLSGKIPQELSQLSFLGFFNVSYNNLSGNIPRGGHLDTFDKSSYEGNPRLLANFQAQHPTPKTREKEEEDKVEDEQMFDGIEWMVIMIGCASGLVVGAIMGNELVVRKPKWFVKLFGRWL